MLINKKTLEHLGWVEPNWVGKKSEDKLLEDLQKILGVFLRELKEVDTENVEPMAGGTVEKNVFAKMSQAPSVKCQVSVNWTVSGKKKTAF